MHSMARRLALSGVLFSCMFSVCIVLLLVCMHLCVFQYLRRGCTQYFCSKQNEQKLNENQKSQQVCLCAVCLLSKTIFAVNLLVSCLLFTPVLLD